MTYGDVDAVDHVTDEAFYALEVATRPADWPTPERRDPARSLLWRRRIEHLLTHDAPGCWVAETDPGEVVGVVAALKREGLWGLSTFAVLPGTQAKGLGKRLLDAALTYAEPDGPGFICSSHDPKAIRRYLLAGFRMHPTMLLYGVPRRAPIPAVHGIREGSANDVELMDSADRATRGAGHGIDHTVLLEQYRLVVVDEGDRHGYCYINTNGAPYQLAATDDEVATRLLWEAFASTSEDAPIDFGHLTGNQVWAVDVATQAGLELYNRGFLALRGLDPPSAYIPSGHFL